MLSPFPVMLYFQTKEEVRLCSKLTHQTTISSICMNIYTLVGKELIFFNLHNPSSHTKPWDLITL
jgi:hypothetical protein